MGRVISVVSGKGGVGKTTVAVGLALALAKSGAGVCLLDLDVGLNNIDVLMGIENKVVYDLCDVLNGVCRIKQALVNDIYYENLYLMPSARGDNESFDIGSVKEVVKKLSSVFNYVIIDAPAGMGHNFEIAVNVARESIVVVTPHVASLRDADKVVSRLKGAGVQLGVVVNRIRGDMVARKEMLNHSQISKLLKVDVLGVVPESDEINILSSFRFERITKTKMISAFMLLAENINNDVINIFDYESKYRGLFGLVRRNLKRSI